MKAVFADTSYWVALLNPKDFLHAEAQKVATSLGSTPIVTSDLVLVEFLNYFGATRQFRVAAVTFVDKLRAEKGLVIVPQGREQFEEALTLYRNRPDKSWSLTDCSSCLLMQGRDIVEVLSSDVNFEQMGFEAVLRGHGQ